MGLSGCWGDITDDFKNDIDLYGDDEYLQLYITDEFMENRVNAFLTKEQATQLRNLLNDVLEEDF
jgi:hypothetical protein